jgi:hypothetical protein
MGKYPFFNYTQKKTQCQIWDFDKQGRRKRVVKAHGLLVLVS